MPAPADRRAAAPATSPVPGDGGDPHLSALPVARARMGWLLLVGGAVGLLASFVLSVERYRLALDPTGYTPSCSLNPVISCGTVMAQEQAAILGFPNPFLGVAAFPVPVTLGAVLLSGTALPRWVWRGLQLGVTAAAVLVAWFVTQAYYAIHALCPYCMVVWAVVVPMFWVLTADNLDRGRIPVPAALHPLVRALVDYRLLVVLLSYALLAALAGVEFWAYWRTLLP
ncbi:vitamin K epoxide reductase family protein [Kineococcus glutinatus]|uniref:Vitamin K epoxide reductase family protein n=1 Tax=Kineococcus glutinatus TaxID=1070872 RepID=A0ABP9HZS1_9ACTN